MTLKTDLLKKLNKRIERNRSNDAEIAKVSGQTQGQFSKDVTTPDLGRGGGQP